MDGAAGLPRCGRVFQPRSPCRVSHPKRRGTPRGGCSDPRLCIEYGTPATCSLGFDGTPVPVTLAMHPCSRWLYLEGLQKHPWHEQLSAQNQSLKRLVGSLAGVAQWIECQLVNQGLTGSIPSQGTCLGCGGPGPQCGARKRQPHTDVSLPFSHPSPLSKNK